MPTLPRILATTAMRRLSLILLCVPLILCSCSVQTYRYFADKAREGEAIYIPRETDKDGGAIFYKAGSKTYVRGIRSRTRAKSSRYIEDYILQTKIHEQHIPVSDAEQKSVYCEVKSQKSPNGRRYWEKTDSPWINSLPDNARPFRSSDYLQGFNSYTVAGVLNSEETRPLQTTAKALYYYPLAAGTFVAVDVPLTLAINAVLACGGAVYLTAAGCEYLFYDVCYMGERCIDAFTSEETSPSPSSGD